RRGRGSRRWARALRAAAELHELVGLARPARAARRRASGVHAVDALRALLVPRPRADAAAPEATGRERPGARGVPQEARVLTARGGGPNGESALVEGSSGQ